MPRHTVHTLAVSDIDRIMQVLMALRTHCQEPYIMVAIDGRCGPTMDLEEAERLIRKYRPRLLKATHEIALPA